MADTDPAQALNFRKDLNGLRAVAVIAVVLFHFDLAGFTGGFVGVDVFFVISGFLMTSIISAAIRQSRFHIVDFYIARAKRIMPALVVVVLASLLAATFLLLPEPFTTAAEHGLQAVLFTINMHFADTSNYFAPARDQSWFLHCWSLAVEIQFYLVIPLLIVVCFRLFPRRGILGGLLIALLASLVVCWFQTQANPTAAFYLPASRIWEFAAGGVIAEIAPLGRLKRTTALIGTALIVAASLLFTPRMVFPGLWPLVPVAGAALVIWARSDLIILTNRPMQWLGDISYSVYLWHWPVLMIGRATSVGRDPLTLALEMGAILALSWLSYRTVELPCRRVWRGVRLAPLAAGLAAVVAVWGLQQTITAFAGFPERVPENIRRIVETGVYGFDWRDRECLLDDKQRFANLSRQCFAADRGGRPSLVLVGDSTVAPYYSGLMAQPWNDRFNIEQITASACNFYGHAAPPMRPFCAEIQKETLDFLLETKPAVVMVSAARGDLPIIDSLSFEKVIAPNQQIIKSFVGQLKNGGVGKVIVVGPPPVWDAPLPEVFARDSLRARRMVDRIVPPAFDKLRTWDHAMRTATEEAGGSYVSLVDRLCRDDGCLTLARMDGGGEALIQFDALHFTSAGAAFVVREAIESVLN